MNNVPVLLCDVLTDDGTLFNSSLSGNYNLHFTAKLVQSDAVKGCQDIQLNWNRLQASNAHYIIEVLTDDEEVVWNSTTDQDHMTISHHYLTVGVKYVAELEVIIDINKDTSLSLGDIPSQLFNITGPTCSKPNGELCWVWKLLK